MPTPPSDVVAGNMAAAATTVTTSASFGDSSVVFCAINATRAAGDFTDTTTMSGLGLTWAKVATAVLAGSRIVTLYVGYGAVPSASGSITITPSHTPNGGTYTVYQQPNMDTGLTSSPVHQCVTTSGSGTSGSISITPATGARMVGVWTHAAGEATTPDSTNLTWSEFMDRTTFRNPTWEAQTTPGSDHTHTASWTTSSAYAGFCYEYEKNVFTLGAHTYVDDAPMPVNGHVAEMHLNGDEDGESGEEMGVWAIMGGNNA